VIHLSPLLAENALFKTIGEIFHPLFVAIAYVLAYIYALVPDYGFAIALLTVVIMAILTPLTVKSTRSMVAMQALQPEMQKLRQKYKGAENREQLNQEMMRLYREHNVSPTGGCLPMFLQMPALIVLYDVIRGLANTVTRGTKLATGARCLRDVCATPRYIPHHSLMYDNLVKTPGVMSSWGMNLAAKPLTHHGNWYAYIPYFAFVVVAVGLQYFQMAQMTRRNRGTQAVPAQMQTMQRIMPLIFAYIYFIVPAGVVVYMIVSSGIRVLTQDLIFRFGLVPRAGEERLSGERKRSAPRGLLGRATAALAPPSGTEGNGAGAGPPAPPGGKPAGGAAGGAGGPARAGEAAGAGQRRPRAQRPTAGTAKAGPSGAGTTSGTTGEAARKAHPRSKSKRARKAR
jgi:YidC/Oxa1 family membrane protein insertase